MIELEFSDGWSFDESARPSVREREGTLRGPEGQSAGVTLERCVWGRLAPAYPAGAHDVELRLDADGEQLSTALAVLAGAVLRADPHCRRLVYAAPAGDLGTISAVEAGGFRYVLDVDLPGIELSLLVMEPASVAAQPAEVADMPTHADPPPPATP